MTVSKYRTLGLALPVLGRGRHVYVFGPGDFSKLPLTPKAELIWEIDD